MPASHSNVTDSTVAWWLAIAMDTIPVAITSANDPSPNLKECLHADDVISAFPAPAK